MRIADLFCGAGGSAYGLSIAGFEVEGFDIVPQPNYPFKFTCKSAFEVDLTQYDAIWASPPCQAYISVGRTRTRQKYQNLIPNTRYLLQQSKLPYIIENIVPAPLIDPVVLCGEMFGLRVLRHRKFESNLTLVVPEHERHNSNGVHRSSRGGGYYWAVNGHEIGTLKQWKDAMGIEWMTSKRELAEAIPPKYSEYLGKQLMRYLMEKYYGAKTV